MSGVTIVSNETHAEIDFGDYEEEKGLGPAIVCRRAFVFVGTDLASNILRVPLGDTLYQLTTVEYPQGGLVVESINGVQMTTNAQLRSALAALMV